MTISEKEYDYDYSQEPFVNTLLGKSVFLPSLYPKATMEERFNFDINSYICDDCGSLLPLQAYYFLFTCLRCGNQWIYGLYMKKYISTYSLYRRIKRRINLFISNKFRRGIE